MLKRYLKFNEIVCEDFSSLLDDGYDFKNLGFDELTEFLWEFYDVHVEKEFKFNYSRMSYIDNFSKIYNKNNYIRIAIAGADKRRAYKYLNNQRIIVEDDLNKTFIENEFLTFTINNDKALIKRIAYVFDIIIIIYNFKTLKYYESRSYKKTSTIEFIDTKLLVSNIPHVVLFEQMLLSLNIFISEFKIFNTLKTLQIDFNSLSKVNPNLLNNYIYFYRTNNDEKVSEYKKKIMEELIEKKKLCENKQ